MEEVSKTLQEVLAKYIDADPRRTVNSVARRSTLSASSIDRIYKGESVKPSLETVLGVTQIVDEKEKCFEIIRQKWPEQAAILKKCSVRDVFKIRDANFDYAGRDIANWAIVMLASRRKSGTTAEEIHAYLPKTGKLKLESLLDDGIVREINRGIRCEDFSTSDIGSCLIKIANMTNAFNRSAIGTTGTRVVNWSEGLSDKGAKQVDEAICEFYAKLEEIRESDDCLGEKPFFLGLLSDKLTTRSIER